MYSDKKVVHEERPMFENLLKALSSGNGYLAGVYKRRRREQEGRSDTEEEKDTDYGSAIVSEEEDSEGGSDSKINWKQAEVSQIQNEPDGVEEQREATDSEYDDEASDCDHVPSLEDNDEATADESESKSSFHVHLEHVLTKEEVNDLTKKTWKFKWEMPAFDSSMSKWVGTGECFLKEISDDSHYGLKLKLYKHWLNDYGDSRRGDFHSSRQRLFFSLCNSYRDIMHCNKKPFYLKGLEEDSSIMDAYIMHALNHVYRTRDLVIKNDAKLAKHEDSTEEKLLHGSGFLDQGFTRPKVLFLLPYRSFALRVVKRLIQLTPLKHKNNVEHIDRLNREFGTDDGEDEGGKAMLSDDANDSENSNSKKSTKPRDHQILFGGNNQDHFVMSIKFTKRSIKLFSNFYSSDIIVASPVGLIKEISENGEGKGVDYLSSIEVLIIDHADVISMQNWSHVNTVVEHLNRTPSKLHSTDAMRIRQWYLDGHAHFYSQTILLGSFLNPDMNALFNRHCVNYEGKAKLVCDHKGVLPKVLLPVRQVFERFDATSVVDVDDARFNHFVKKVFPKIKDSIQGGTMLFISSYFEFVRIRNFVKSQNCSFCVVVEYSGESEKSRARNWFFHGTRKIMLYTERAHFYHRYKIRGIQNLIIYSLPERKDFYPEMLNMLDGSKSMMCNVLFSRFDFLQLERIVGSTAAKRLLSSEKAIFVFC